MVIFWSNTAATELFPGIGFQITTEANSTDDLPSNEQNRFNPIRLGVSFITAFLQLFFRNPVPSREEEL
jgi:hypothetical protein